MAYKRIKVWSVLLRLFHWAFALSIVTLCITGYYIHNPFALGPWEGTPTTFIMAKTRLIHFIAGFIFIAAVIVRFYLLFFGNRFERFTDFVPITPRNFKRLLATIKHYLYLSDEHVPHGGHNPLAGTVYLVMLLLSILMIFSGLFLLFPESSFWVGWGKTLFGTQQSARLVHYFFFWVFLVFSLIHVYLVVWNDIFGCEAIVSSIFSGRKFVRSDKH